MTFCANVLNIKHGICLHNYIIIGYRLYVTFCASVLNIKHEIVCKITLLYDIYMLYVFKINFYLSTHFK